MNRKILRDRYVLFMSEHKKLEEEKKKCLKQYLDNQTLIQVHSANIIRSVNNIMNMDLFEHFKLSEEFIIHRPVQREIWKINRSTKFWEEDVPMFSDEEFKEQFRMNRQSFEKLCTRFQFLAREDTVIRKAIPLEKRIAIVLYTLGSCQNYKSVATLFGVGRSTVGELVVRFARGVCNTMEEEFVKGYPPTTERVEEIVDGFERVGMPQCYGVLGTCHIEISANQPDSLECFNSEGWFSTVLLGIVDHKGRFTYTNVGATGGTPHNEIFENSPLKTIHEQNEIFNEAKSKLVDCIKIPVILVSNSSFRLLKFVMKPYKVAPNSDLTNDQKFFNDILVQCQKISTDTYEHLKARFARLSQSLEIQRKNCNTIINACCILHNFLVDENDYVWGSWLNELEERESKKARLQPHHVIEADIDDDGLRTREALVRLILSRRGC